MDDSPTSATSSTRDDGRRHDGRRRLVLGAAVLLGIAAGLGAFTFVYARGASYLTNDPAACANCHIMSEHYAAWIKSSHHTAAACNDCHTPHDLLGKYATKARNGFWHSFYFTTGGYPDPLRITGRNRAITENACRDCHRTIVEAIDPETPPRQITLSPTDAHPGVDASCIRCHRYVGHWVR